MPGVYGAPMMLPKLLLRCSRRGMPLLCRRLRPLIFLSFFIAILALAPAQDALPEITALNTERAVIRWSRTSSVTEYLKRHIEASRPDAVIDIRAVDYSASEGAALERLSVYEGENDTLRWTGEEGWVEWTFNVADGGVYCLSLRYIPVEVKGMELEFAVLLDGELPYDDFASVMFPRSWKDAGPIRKDGNDNDLRPDQLEAPRWSDRDFIDTQGFYNKRLPLFLTRGRHRLRLVLRREALVMSGIRLYNPSDPPVYAETAFAKKAESAREAEKGLEPVLVKVQAETPFLKSDSSLVPTYDRSSAATEPSHPAKIRLNTLGGNWTWKLPGQWAEWTITVPRDGYYRLFIKGRQNYQRGMAASLRISVDGFVPAAEYDNFEFPYSLEWSVRTPLSSADDAPCLLYLAKGSHQVRLEAILGRLTPILTAVDDLTYEVNTIRRRFIMIMGSEPDLFRDYQLEKEIPGLAERLVDLSNRFTAQADEFERITGQKGSEAATLRRMADQLADFAERPEYIPHHQINFRDNIAALATWILFRKEVPLELDYIGFASAAAALPKANANFFVQAWSSLQSFLASFVEDYTSIGAREKGDVVNVWISAGRDQAQILRDLITNDFTPKTGVRVNLSLVQGSLIEATLAGKGPEIAINVSRGQPVNLASRNALYDLSTFSSFPDVANRFRETAFTPYSYSGGVYALPLTQDFHMMFYRKDILRELGVAPPETWEDLYRAIPVLQRNNMQIGLPYQQTDALELIDAGMGARNLFPTLLSQQGGAFYLDDGRRTGLMEAPAYAAFKQWTDFYSSYGFVLKYDFYTRFRSGEMPIGIASYGLYNQLMAAAPEIRNEWGMLPVPGTIRPDGSIDRSEAASGTASVMFSHIKNPEAGWDFLRWWASGEVQLAYARQMEILLGKAARMNTANLYAFDRLPWSKAEAAVIKTQWEEVKEVPEVPGAYYTIRMLDTAFSKVYYDFANPRATLYKYCQLIDEELERKRKELGLE